MIIGKFKLSTDRSMRIKIPNSILKNMCDGEFEGKNLFISCAGDCLKIYSPIERKQIEEEVIEQNIFSGSNTKKCKIDKSGRITIPVLLGDKVRIGRKSRIICVGLGNHIEIWDVDEFNKYSIDFDFSQIFPNLFVP